MRRGVLIAVAALFVASCGEGGQYVATEAQRAEFRRDVEATLAMSRLHVNWVEERGRATTRRSIDYLAPDFTAATVTQTGGRPPRRTITADGSFVWAKPYGCYAKAPARGPVSFGLPEDVALNLQQLLEGKLIVDGDRRVVEMPNGGRASVVLDGGIVRRVAIRRSKGVKVDMSFSDVVDRTRDFKRC